MGEDGHDHADHQHAFGDHTHSMGANADGRYLTIVVLLIVGFMVFEVVAGIGAHSLAQIADDDEVAFAAWAGKRLPAEGKWDEIMGRAVTPLRIGGRGVRLVEG